MPGCYVKLGRGAFLLWAALWLAVLFRVLICSGFRFWLGDRHFWL